jgi:hypothetical protein
MEKLTLTSKELQWLENHNEIATFERLLEQSRNDPAAVSDLEASISGLKQLQNELLSKAEQEALLQRLDANSDLKYEAQWSAAVRAGYARLAYQNATGDNWSAYYKWWPLGLLLFLFIVLGYVLWPDTGNEPSATAAQTNSSGGDPASKTQQLIEPPQVQAETLRIDTPEPPTITNIEEPRRQTTKEIDPLVVFSIKKNEDQGINNDFIILFKEVSIDQYNFYAQQNEIKPLKGRGIMPALVTADEAKGYANWIVAARHQAGYNFPSPVQLLHALNSKFEVKKYSSKPEWVLTDSGAGLQVISLDCNNLQTKCSRPAAYTRAPKPRDRCAFRLVVQKG